MNGCSLSLYRKSLQVEMSVINLRITHLFIILENIIYHPLLSAVLNILACLIYAKSNVKQSILASLWVKTGKPKLK